MEHRMEWKLEHTLEYGTEQRMRTETEWNRISMKHEIETGLEQSTRMMDWKLIKHYYTFIKTEPE